MRAQTTSDKQLMKIADVARRLNVGRSMVYELIRHGELTPIHIGRAVRFDAADVDKLIEGLAAAAQAARQPPAMLGAIRHRPADGGRRSYRNLCKAARQEVADARHGLRAPVT
ncbi:MAG: helix-turn-helix domain-containing protein [Chloroflexi bacterium]|nr:helix-turn-helix domain-containing protein [Chloroflexota bacterium]